MDATMPAKTTTGPQVTFRLDEQAEAALAKAREQLAARGMPLTQSQVVRFAIVAYAAQIEREHAK